MKTNEQIGDIKVAIEYVISQLISEKRYDLLEKWDSLRGNDWIVLTKKDCWADSDD